MSADQHSHVATLIERLADPELTVRIHAGVLLGALGVEARPALATLLALGQSEEVPDR